MSEKYTFNVSVKAVEIFLINNEKLQIFPTLKKPITSNHLLGVTSDHTRSRANSIMFFVKKKPELGRLILIDKSGNFKEIDKFTQSEVNETKIWYQHTKKFKNLMARDFFEFDLHADFTRDLAENVST